MFDDRVPVELGPRPTAIIAEDDALAASRAGVSRDQHIDTSGLEAARIARVHHGAAREGPVAPQARIDRGWQLGPMEQIATDRVTPVHVTPVPAIRIVLVEQMP